MLPIADRRRLVQLLVALGDELPQVILVGGWAHRLFGHHRLARQSVAAPITTKDADVVVPRDARLGHDLDRQLRDRGFNAEIVGTQTPPAIRYTPADLGARDSGEFHVEFLVPRIVGEDRTTFLIAGVGAQVLSYLDMIIDDLWTVAVDEPHGYPTEGRRFEVRIPNAARYLVHKLVVLPDRSKAKRANDVRYVHDTLQIFADALGELRALATPIRWSPKRRAKLAKGLAIATNEDLAVVAAAIPDMSGGTVRVGDLIEVVRAGIDEILRPDTD